MQKATTCIGLASYTPQSRRRVQCPFMKPSQPHCFTPIPSLYKLKLISEENGTSEPNSGGGGGGDGGGGGLIEQIISHLPVAISSVLNTSAAAESSNEDKGGDKPEAKRAEEPEGIVTSPRIALPVDHNGPDSEF